MQRTGFRLLGIEGRKLSLWLYINVERRDGELCEMVMEVRIINGSEIAVVLF